MRTVPRYTHLRVVCALIAATVLALSAAPVFAQTQPLVCSPASPDFRKVPVGGSKTVLVKMTNTGSTTVTVQSTTIAAAGFSIANLTLPLQLKAGQSSTFTIVFTPQSDGMASGQISYNNNGPVSPLVMNVTGTGIGSGTLSANPASLDFNNVPVGQSQTQFETITNTGGKNVSLTRYGLTGAGFSVTGLNLPQTLAPGASITFNVTFTPASVGSISGSLTVISGPSNSAVVIGLVGTAVSAGQLAVSPASLNFGTVTVGQQKSKTGTLSATGASVTISSDTMTSSAFTVSGISLPLTLGAGQNAPFTITFAPQTSGGLSATLSFNSDASNSPATQSLSGTGAVQHAVGLSWDPSTSQVSGYNVYRGTTSGGPYSKINSALDPNTSYIDNTVMGGNTYYYVTTAVDNSGDESTYSNEVPASVPSP